MIRLVCYSDENMSISRTKCIGSFLEQISKSELDFDRVSVHEWDSDMMKETEFYQLNQDIFQEGARGAGCYWLFKPYIIYKAMLDMNDGDILVYSDAGVEFINDISHIINVMDEDVFLFGNNYNHVDWCKGDVLKTVCPEYYPEELFYGINPYESVKQVQASVIFFRISKQSKEFVKEWLMYCQMPNLIDDSPSKEPNYPTFAEHRHDQSVICCLQIKYGYRLHYWPASYNDGAFVYDKIEQYKGDKYPIIFLHHRKRNAEWK